MRIISDITYTYHVRHHLHVSFQTSMRIISDFIYKNHVGHHLFVSYLTPSMRIISVIYAYHIGHRLYISCRTSSMSIISDIIYSYHVGRHRLRLVHGSMSGISGYRGRRFKARHRYFVSMSKTLYPHCFSRLCCEMSTRWGQPCEGCSVL